MSDEQSSQLHPRDQWFREYAYTEGETDAKGEKWITPPSWGPVEQTTHNHHPDSYHPDPRVRVAHHREVRRAGVALTACGKEHDPRMRVIEPHEESDRCPECASATEEAKEGHAQALAILKEHAERGERAPVEATLAASKSKLTAPQVEPQVVDPETVDEALSETIPETLGTLDDEPPP
jgi:hypothetical protein